MKQLLIFIASILVLQMQSPLAQTLKMSDFESLAPGAQDDSFYLPDSHAFQILVQRGDPLSSGGGFPQRFDFTGYVPSNGSSSKGHVSLNSEAVPGGVSMIDLHLNTDLLQWVVDSAFAVDFSLVNGTGRNCSGGVTPWETVITCEEYVQLDENQDGYYDLGWCVEIDPVSRKVIDHPGGLEGADKLWALGNFKHENVVVHSNLRTLYEGEDDPNGYLLKFVADNEKDLSSGQLYVYKGEKAGSGSWLPIQNDTPETQNTTKSQCLALQATTFKGIEDVEISPIDGKVYFAVKGENCVYRFSDLNALTDSGVVNFETFVGNASYELQVNGGQVTEPWGTGNDNLAFDAEGNLWITQDGSKNYVWMVDVHHSQEIPSVKIFARIPAGAEPTGITFTPDFKYLFLSIQHPSADNISSVQYDAFGEAISFERDAALIIALKENLNHPTAIENSRESIVSPPAFPNPCNQYFCIPTTVLPNSFPDVYDARGKKQNLPCSTFAAGYYLDTQALADGLYIWYSGDLSGKFMVKH